MVESGDVWWWLMAAMRRFSRFVVRAALFVAAVWLSLAGLAAFSDDSGDGPVLVAMAIGAMILFAVLGRGRKLRPSGAEGAPATIMRIWQDPPPGAPAIYWTFVLFDVRGERVKVRLSKQQARQFLDRHSPGDVGRLSHRGETLVGWQAASSEHPVADAGLRAFISYERSWSDDATYVARFLESRGIQVWIDTDELRAGSRLSSGVVDAIAGADAFIPILSDSYMTSGWCLREFETALERGVPIRPVKVQEGKLITPPHLRKVMAPILDTTVYVDLRGREPVVQLEDFAASLVAPGRR
jgi:hypothetical protein